MPITTKDVQHMAELARLDIAPETQELFASQFADILNYMDVLSHVDTQGIEPMYSPSLHTNAVREDVVKPSAATEHVLANAPENDGQYFIVPRIV